MSRRTTTRPRTTSLAAALLLAGSALTASVATSGAAQAASASSCGDLEHVTGADWLRVHKSPNSKAVVGQIPHGAAFCVLSVGKDTIGGHSWDEGYGRNGSVTLHGYVADEYLS